VTEGSVARSQHGRVAGNGTQAAGRRRPARSLDRAELSVLALLIGVSLWIAALDLWQVLVDGRLWTGTDGMQAQDQLQYLAWIREASRHVLVSNLFVLRHTPADFFQPLIAISGGAVALGLSPSLALLLWKPVAVGCVFVATRAYVGRVIEAQAARNVALVLALFGGLIGLPADAWLPFWSWGYPFGLIALAALLGTILWYEHDRVAGRIGWQAPALAAITSWLHPWQGEILILILLGAEGLSDVPRIRRRLMRMIFTLAAAAVPLIYVAILGRVDSSWRLGQQLFHITYPASDLALAAVVLVVPAALAYRLLPRGFLTSATISWPVAAFVVFVGSQTPIGAVPLHAFLGITVPLGVLLVRCATTDRSAPPSRLRRPLLIFAVALLTLPVAADELGAARTRNPQLNGATFLKPGEQEAFGFLARDRDPGGVLTSYYLGTAVPGATGRRTFLGDFYWSQPNFDRRQALTNELFSSRMSPHAARTFVLMSGARFVLVDCQSRGDLNGSLSPIASSVHRFGCARVYDVRRMRLVGRRRPPTRRASMLRLRATIPP
jgi:hypothetical protein